MTVHLPLAVAVLVSGMAFGAERLRRCEPIGAPSLPVEVEVVEIPAGSVCTGVTFAVQSWRRDAGTSVPEPIQRPCRGDAAVSWTEPDAAYYGREVWPEVPVELAGTFTVEGRRMQRIRVSRQRWRGGMWPTAATGVVEVAEGLSFTPLFARAATLASSSGGPCSVTASSSTSPRTLLILAPPDLHAAWDIYAARRREQLPDWQVQVVGTEEIYRDYPFGPSLANRNAAESIHAYLRAVAQPGSTHALLGGMWCDAASPLPERWFLTGERLSLSNCVPGVCARPHVDELCTATPSDLFYACLDGNTTGAAYPWDPDGDGVYLTADEVASCDCVADIVVGRFAPVPYDAGDGVLQTPFQIITNYAARVARGQGLSFAGTNRLGFASGCLQATAPRGGTALGRPHREQTFFDGVANVWATEHPDEVTDGEWMTRETLRTVIAPQWPILEVESLHSGSALRALRYATWTEATAAFFARDQVYAMCRSHGSETYVAGGSVTRTLCARATGLTLFHEFAVPCLAGALACTRTEGDRVYVLPSLGLAATASVRGGALSGLYNVSYGWSDSFGGLVLSDGYSSTLGYQTAKNLFAAGDETFGLAVLHARQQYAAQYEPTGIRLFSLCEQFFFGDPSLGLPPCERAVALPATTTCEEPRAVVSARRAYAADSIVTGGGPFRVMDAWTSAGTNVAIGVRGGVGGQLAFEGASGRINLTGDEVFYVGGVSNCAEIVLSGENKTVDVTGAGATLRRISATGNGTNILRCTTKDGLAKVEPIRVENGWLQLETAEASGAGNTVLAAVTNGGLRWAASPLAGWDDDTEHLARPLWLKDATLQFEGEHRVTWGRHVGSTWNPLTLHVAGTSTVTGVSVGLVGTTTVDLVDDGALILAVPLVDEDSGHLVFTGSGRVEVASTANLAGTIEVAEGATLDLRELPLSVLSVTVRAGATLRLPPAASGRHDVVVGGGTLTIESGARVEDTTGNLLTGFVVDGTFFEPSSTLRLKGGAGIWSDPQGWYDATTDAYGPWIDGRNAVFDSARGSTVSNDLVTVVSPSLVFRAETTLSGGRVHLESGTFTVPANVSVSVGLPLVLAGEVVKYGAGHLQLRGNQNGVTTGGVSVAEGILTLKDVTAFGVTNLAAAAGTRVEIQGRNVFTAAVVPATLATNALVVGTADASLIVAGYRPQRGTEIPAGLELVVLPQEQEGYANWNCAVAGRLDYRGILSLLYGRIEGPGTLRVAGMRSQSTYGATFGGCRLELAPSNGVFSVYEDLSWGNGVFVFDGTTVAPTGNVVVSSAVYPSSRTILYVDEGGIAFDVPTGVELVFGDAAPTYLFGGSGGLIKRGPGCVRFATVADQHEGPTRIEQGVYALETWTTLKDLRISAGAVVDLSAPYPSALGLTNLVLSTGSCVKVGVVEDGADLLDVRGGVLSLPTNGVARLEATVAPGTPPGLYGVLVADEFPDSSPALDLRLSTPAGHQARWYRASWGLAVRVLPAATTILLR